MKLNQSIKTTMSLAAVMGTLALAASSATAAVIITPLTASASDSIDGTRVLQNTVDGSGLIGAGSLLTQLHQDTGEGGSSTYWLTNINPVSLTLTFDLNGTRTVDTVHLWNYSATNTAFNRGLSSFDVSFSTDGGNNYVSTINVAGFASAGAAGVDTPSQTKLFTAVNGVTHIQLTNLVNHGGDRFGLGEIRFGDSVPEPTTTALLGLGGLALILRRRK